MTEQIDFLRPNVSHIRHQIKNILESYNHDWDLIAELAQNSVDAIRLRQPKQGQINLEIDAPQKRIVFEDNGCGISPHMLPGLLTPFSSDKYGNQHLIGQKGVGITFVIFCTSYFEIESHHKDGSSRASLEGAWSWIEAQSDSLPQLTFEQIQASTTFGTKITISLPKSVDNNYFRLTFEQLQMILRTRTAIGDTENIWGATPDKKINLIFHDLNGNSFQRELDCSYFLPISNLTRRRHQYISLEEFDHWNTGQKSDIQKRQKLRNKVVYTSGELFRAGRTLRYWACFVPKRRDWDVVSVNSGLIEKENILNLNPVKRMEKYGDAEYLFSGGMYTSTRGMPTGIRSDITPRGSAGYLPNFFIILDDPELSFDIGRKSIPSRQLGMLRNIAADQFRNMLVVVKKYLGGGHEVVEDNWDRSIEFNTIREMANLGSKHSKFIKRPAEQEATVVAIFFEMIGSGRIVGFRPYISGYKNRYDLYAKYNDADVVVEFKYSLSSLLQDFDEEAKLFFEVDIAIVWEITESDHEVVNRRVLDLEPIEVGLTDSGDSNFHYLLSGGYNKPIRVMCLKDIVLSSS